MALPLMGLIGGATQIVGSLIGGGARKREQRAAQAEFNQQKQALQDFQFTNQFSGLENVAEDLTINQQAAQFQAQQTDQALASSLQTAAMVGGAPGGAQAIAQAALQAKQGASADIARQEQRNEAMRVQQEAQNQFRAAQSADDIQLRTYDKSQQMLNLAAGRKSAADQARKDATAALVGGIGSLAGGIGAGMAGADAAGGFGKALLTNVGGIPK